LLRDLLTPPETDFRYRIMYHLTFLPFRRQFWPVLPCLPTIIFLQNNMRMVLEVKKKAVLVDIEPQGASELGGAPEIPRGVYRERIHRIERKMTEKGIDALVIYGDKEHFGNIKFCSGFDPRFEEALLLITFENGPMLLVGDEGVSYCKGTLKIDCDAVLWPPLSLMGMPREKLKTFGQLLKEAGIRAGMKVGTVGWKYFTSSEFEDSELEIEIPSYMVDELRKIVGTNNVVNSTDIFMHPGDGLRSCLDIHEIAVAEYAGTLVSGCVNRVIEKLEPGMSEYEAIGLMKLNGYPLSTHVMLMSGERNKFALASPSAREISLGDPLTVAVGFWGSLVCRAAYVVGSTDHLPDHDSDYLSHTCIPYFELMSEWYTLLRVSTLCGEIFESVTSRTAKMPFNLFSAGHLTHLEEWTHTPFFSNSPIRIRSGMILQADFIPVMSDPLRFGVNVEDTVAVADEHGRYELQVHYPSAYRRIEHRRQFMTEELGMKIDPDVLPLCNNQALLRPFLLASQRGLKIQDQ